MSEPTAVIFVFAGNNGSGKSTIRNLIIDRLGISVDMIFLQKTSLEETKPL
ncbi:hypothetical protein [Paenibacillus luteus]|uniref:hypothetical protein n=1 Tax=Paenibacillus luteus TaxID=2545753 RepID=UPI001F4F1EEF|nr:hypothetical protein [Paenibacillus luteus]